MSRFNEINAESLSWIVEKLSSCVRATCSIEAMISITSRRKDTCVCVCMCRTVQFTLLDYHKRCQFKCCVE